MNQRPAVLLFSVALAGIAAGFFYASRQRRESTALLHDIRDSAQRSANRSQATYRILKNQRRALRALCDYVLPVPKGVENPAS
jgi:hypothetical protein